MTMDPDHLREQSGRPGTVLLYGLCFLLGAGSMAGYEYLQGSPVYKWLQRAPAQRQRLQCAAPAAVVRPKTEPRPQVRKKKWRKRRWAYRRKRLRRRPAIVLPAAAIEVKRSKAATEPGERDGEQTTPGGAAEPDPDGVSESGQNQEAEGQEGEDDEEGETQAETPRAERGQDNNSNDDADDEPDGGDEDEDDDGETQLDLSTKQ